MIYRDGRTEVPSYEPLSGRLATTTDALSQIKNFSYFPDDQLKSITYANLAPLTAATASVSYTYDSNFTRLATMTDGAGLTSYTYHPVGHLGALMPATVDGPLPGLTDLISYTFDHLGRGKTRNIGPLGTENLVTLNYDNLGRLQSTVNHLGSFNHFYIGDTQRTDYINLPNGQKTSFDYFSTSGDNRLKTIHDLANASNPTSTLSKFDYTYLKDGKIATWQRQFSSAAATQMTLSYDLVDQLTSATIAPVTNLTSITQRHSYQYDKAGNRSSEQSGSAVSSALHNNANQITNATNGGKILVSGNTNEPAKVKVNGQAATITAPPENLYQAWVQVTPGPNTLTIEATDYAAPTPNVRTKSWSLNITSPPARSFSYDTNGNTLSDGLRTYQWDAEDRLVKITQGANVYEFIYDGFSRRVAEKTNGTTTRRLLWDGTQIADHRASDGTSIQRRYYSEGEQRIGGTDAGNYYYTRDHLGSIHEVTDSSATVRSRYDYAPYGKRTKLGGDLDCDFAFTGHYYHTGSNLHLTLYRAYDQELGRWLSVDPIRETGGLNLYGYVRGNPINMLDPLGLQPPSWPPPPENIPGGPWKWHEDPKNGRGGTLRPSCPAPGKSPPTLTWSEPTNNLRDGNPNGYWKRSDGAGYNQRYTPDGRPISADAAHPRRPSPSPAPNPVNPWLRALDRLLRIPFLLMPPEELLTPPQNSGGGSC